MGNSTGNTNKKSMKTSKNDETKEKSWSMLTQKGKINGRKNSNAT